MPPPAQAPPPHQKSSLLFPGFGEHRGQIVQIATGKIVEAEKLELLDFHNNRGNVVYSILTWAQDTHWLSNLEYITANVCALSLDHGLLKGESTSSPVRPSVECPAHSGGFINAG